MGRIRVEQNTLTRGEISAIEAASKQSKAYAAGCEEVSGFDIRSNGLSPSLGPDLANETWPLQYRAIGYNDKYYLRNSSTGIALDNSNLPVEPEVVKTLSYAVSKMVNNGDFRSAVPTSDPDYSKYRITGRWDTDQGAAVGKLIDGADTALNRTLIVTKTTRVYRAFSPTAASGMAGSVDGWGVHGQWYWQRNAWDSGGFFPKPAEDASATLTSIVRGDRGNVQNEWNTATFNLRIGMSISLYSEELAPGTYEFNAGTDIYLIGTPGMFRDSPQAHTYSQSYNYWGASGSLTITEDRTWCGNDAIIIGYNQIVNPANQHTGGWQGLAALYTKKSSASDSSFVFTSKTSLIGSRRFGAAQYNFNPENLAATKIAGSTAGVGLGDQADGGRSIPTAVPAASDAYVLKIEGGVVWFEEIIDGIIVGSPTGEFVVRNHQVCASYQGGASIQRISSIGSPGNADDIFSQSARLAGNVYFISHFGITTMQFSTESQNYLPKNFESKGRRFDGEVLTSIAASVEERCLYFVTNRATMWKLWPETGALAQLPLTFPSGAALRGVFTRASAPNVYVAIQKSNGSIYISALYSVRVTTSYLRTTAFGRYPGARAIVKKLLITGVAMKSGKYRLAGGDWKAFLSLSDTLSGFTGTKEIWVSDSPGKPGAGKTVEFIIDGALENAGILTGISVEMEV